MSAVDWVQILRPWQHAGVLGASDVHVAAALARLSGLGPDDADVVLATALAARAPRLGHVCLDLATADAIAIALDPLGDDDDRRLPSDDLQWPTDPSAWHRALSSSPLTAASPSAPLVLEGSLLYLERYHDLEERLAAHVLRRTTDPGPPVTRDEAADGLLEQLLPGDRGAAQRAAADAGTSRPLSVIVGGPGTGKTRTVGTLLAALLTQRPDARVALVAPTGKAAARLSDGVRAVADEVRGLGPEHHDLATRLDATPTSTIHRLLGPLPGGRFRHGPHDPLRLDAVVVDETSMVSLPLMVELLDAVPATANVVLVGDPGQLASGEAGSVLCDRAGPVVRAVTEGRPGPTGPLSGSVSVLTYGHRFPTGSAVDRFATAVRAGDTDAAIAALHQPRPDDEGGVVVEWVPAGADTTTGSAAVLDRAGASAHRTADLASAGEATAALSSLGELRVLCAHRRGPFGVSRWNHLIARSVNETVAPGPGRPDLDDQPGTPVLITANDPVNALYNGDLGVLVTQDEGVTTAFTGAAGVRLIAPSRLGEYEVAHALTIHKSQGSEFDHVVVVLPPADSRLASRELLYTAVTRARRRVTLVGDEAALRAAIEHRVDRASGLGPRVWPGS